MIVSFDSPTALTVYRTVSGMCDAILSERGATMAQLDRTDLGLAEAVESLFAGGQVASVEIEPHGQGIAVTFHHSGPSPSLNTGARQLLDAAFEHTDFDAHQLRLAVGIET